MLVFEEREKQDHPWHQSQDLNLSHIDGRQELYHCATLALQGTSTLPLQQCLSPFLHP